MNVAGNALALGLALLGSGAAFAQETTRVSVDSSGAEATGISWFPSLSADGQIVAFNSDAPNLVSGDANVDFDIFVHEESTGITTRVSVDSSGAEAKDNSFGAQISSDGQVVAFYSAAKNLVAGDTNANYDVFVHDRSTGVTERVSVDSSGAQANAGSRGESISADGQIIAFFSFATNLVGGDTNGVLDIFVHDRTTGITERVSVDSSGGEGNGDSGSAITSISGDGQIVAFYSSATNLVAGDTNGVGDIFVHDRTSGVTERVSVDSSGAQGNDNSGAVVISANGQFVAFGSGASNLVAGDTNGCGDVLVHDRLTGITERISVDSSGAAGNGASSAEGISSDGRLVAFSSVATNLISGDTNAATDVFIHDRTTGLTERMSVDSSGAEGNGGSVGSTVSANGNIVAFYSGARNLVAGDTNKNYDVFVHERCSIDATWSNYGAGYPGTSGIPSFTSRQNPSFGGSIDLDLENSSGAPTFGLLFVGFQRTSIHSGWGGDLLVVPALVLPISFSSGSNTLSGVIPNDWTLCGVSVDLQAIEADPGAAKGVSFTQGLELVLGH